ncbi:MAG TPA: 23S rRNA (pseudouridine(1915)-N(3))-methyltransferase RlmH [Candidatus Gracilibacteria bacterium]|nr:23S rRNA (pseudouridine(1915)-N(3))-methyltransferase RlmH [Candidatus Gracilibacteria bacterium]
MNITIVQVGKTRTDFIAAAEQEYSKRLQSDAKVQVKILKSGKGEVAKIKEDEGQAILEALPKDSFVIVLHEYGKQLTSPEFAELIQQKKDSGTSHITFVIGGTYGLSESVLKRTNFTLSFSKMTFTHEMIRPLLLEQLYRAFSIVKGKTYHY